jgi:glycosyltransferase involved in cell wall biosynthesis
VDRLSESQGAIGLVTFTQMSVSGTPLVTALVSTYNSERFLQGCLRDLEQQTIADRIEIVVVDSGSCENEAEVAMAFAEEFGNVIYERTDERETIYAAWNRGLARARGIYVTNANTDDRHRRDAYEVLSTLLDERPEVALVYADSAITEAPDESFESAHVVGVFRWPEFSNEVLFGESCVGPQPMWRRSLHERYGPFDGEFEVAGDYEWWLRIAKSEKLVHIPEVLGLYYLSEDTLGRRNPERTYAEVQRARERHWPIERGSLPPYGTDYVDAVGVLGQERQRALRELREWIISLREAKEWHLQQTGRVQDEVIDLEREVTVLREAEGWYRQQAEAERMRVDELRSMLDAIEHSRAYRIGLAAQRIKNLTAESRLRVAKQFVRIIRGRVRQR